MTFMSGLDGSVGSRRVRRRGVSVVGTALVLATALGACSSTDKDSATPPSSTVAAVAGTIEERISGPADGTTPTPGGPLVMGVEADTEAMDPGRVPLAASGYFIASSVFDSLATLDENGKAVPFLATSIESSNDAKTWTVTIPKDVKYHNGDPLTPEAVAKVLNFYRESTITGSFFRTVTSIVPEGDDKIIIELSEAWVGFPVSLTTQVGYVMHPSMIDDTALAFTPIGTGPFVHDRRVPGESWSFRKNPEYWRKDAEGRSLPYLDEIDFLVRPDEQIRMTDLNEGRIDVMHTVKPEQVLKLRETTDFKRVEYADGEKDFLSLNTAKAPFDDVVARRALAFAIDSEKWREQIALGVKPSADSPFSPGQPGFGVENGYPQFDLNEAKKLASEYEAKHGNPIEFTMIAGDDPSDLAEAQLLVDMAAEAGMRVKIESLPQPNIIAKVVLGEYQVSVWRTFGMPDFDADVSWLRSESVVEGGVSLNTARFADPAIDEALTDALAAKSPDERLAAYTTVSKRLGEEVPYVWLGRVVWNLAANARVNGIYPAANGSIQTLGEKSWMGDLWIQR